MGKIRKSFSTSSFSSTEFETESSDADPRVGLVNLADVMLVFACGLMLALVAYWNLDISSMQEIVQGREVTEVQDIQQMQDGLTEGGGGFVELGKVYQDPMTGKYYMLQEDVDKSVTTEGGQEQEENGTNNSQNGPPQENQSD